MMDTPFCARCEAERPDDGEHCAECGQGLVERAAWKDADEDPMLGAEIDGRYVVTGKLGAGGMGSVYRGDQTAMGREVAIKMLRRDFGEDSTLVERFQREARNSSKLEHPNTVRVFDFGKSADGDLYLVMELLRGGSLAQVIGERGVSAERAIHIARQIARSVGEAHKKGLVHRDLKPANVQVMGVEGDADFVKVLDFGLAKLAVKEGAEEGDQSLTTAGAALGTPLYMSPEQCAGQRVDGRTDIYSLGAILHEMLAGSPPFVGASSVMTLTMHIRDPVPPLSAVRPDLQAPPALQQIIFRAMEKDPANRFQAMDELVQALDYAAAPESMAGGSVPALAAFPDPSRTAHSAPAGAAVSGAGAEPAVGIDETCAPESGQVVPVVSPSGAVSAVALGETMASDPSGVTPAQYGSGIVSQPGVPAAPGQYGSGIVSQPGFPSQPGAQAGSLPGQAGQPGYMPPVPGVESSQVSSAVAGELAARSGIMDAQAIGGGGRKGVVLAVAALLLLGAGAGAWVLLGGKEAPQEPPPAASASPAVPAPAPKAEPASAGPGQLADRSPEPEPDKPKPSPVTVKVTGRPSSARFTVNGASGGKLGQAYEDTGDAETLKIEVARKGYEPFAKEFARSEAVDGRLEIKVKLKRKKRKASKRRKSGDGYEEFEDDSYEEF